MSASRTTAPETDGVNKLAEPTAIVGADDDHVRLVVVGGRDDRVGGVTDLANDLWVRNVGLAGNSVGNLRSPASIGALSTAAAAESERGPAPA